MKTLFSWVVPSLFVVLIAAYLWMHVRRDTDSIELVATPAANQARDAEQKYEDAQDAAPDIESIEYHPTASDHVGGSVVGTSKTILQKTFGVTSAVQLPFSVPAHAYSPQLHGAFRSYLQGGKLESNPSKSDVEFLVLNDEEYTDLVKGRPSNAIFSCDATHDQEVNANLPPTLDQPVTYHLVFRNNVRSAQKKLVQADFRIDY